MDEKKNNQEKNIKTKTVLLIDDNGKNLGILETKDAYLIAQNKGLDLVQVGEEKNNIPVCKIMDFGKWKYEQSKKKKAVKTAQQNTKEIKIRPNTSEHDLKYRAQQAIEFLDDGDKVKISVKFKGRERNYIGETGRLAMEKFLSVLDSTKYRIEKPVEVNEKEISLTLIPSRNN